MKRLILSATNKGGAGKSFATIQIVQWLKEHPGKPAFQAFDPDHANRTLEQVHKDVTKFIDVEEPSSLDSVFNSLAEVDVSIVDGLGSQQKKTFGAWVDEVDLIGCAKEMGFGITYLLVVTEERDLIRQTKEVVEKMGDKVNWIVAKNYKQFDEMARGEQKGKMITWDQSATRDLLLNKLNAIEINLWGLRRQMATFLDKHAMPISVAAQDTSINILERQRFVTAWRDIKVEIDKAAPFICPLDGKAAEKSAPSKPGKKLQAEG